MEKVLSFRRKVRNMKVIGKMIRWRVRAHYGVQIMQSM
jgi:hypothetical protein